MTKILFEGMSAALFSPDRDYRYVLFRRLANEGSTVNFIGLNPSTADETKNDPTVRRCIGYAEKWSAALLVVTNIFAFRATNPRDMKKTSDPIGPENDAFLREWAEKSDLVIAAWGANGAYKSRGEEVVEMLTEVSDLYALTLTIRGGHPKHPLYLAKSLDPRLWRRKR